MPDPEGLSVAQAPLLELISRLLIAEADAATLDALRDPAIASVLDQLERGCAAYLDTAASSPPEIEELASEYCRLFLMSVQTSPCASAWAGTNPLEAGAALSDRVTGWMATLAVDIEAGPWGNVPRDHLAVLLGLLALALHADDAVVIADLRTHALDGWVGRFTAAVRDATPNPLYRATVGLLDETLAPT